MSGYNFLKLTTYGAELTKEVNRTLLTLRLLPISFTCKLQSVFDDSCV